MNVKSLKDFIFQCVFLFLPQGLVTFHCLYPLHMINHDWFHHLSVDNSFLFFNFIFTGQLVSLFYYLLQLHEMLCAQFMSIFSSNGGLVLVKCLWGVGLFLNTLLICMECRFSESISIYFWCKRICCSFHPSVVTCLVWHLLVLLNMEDNEKFISSWKELKFRYCLQCIEDLNS